MESKSMGIRAGVGGSVLGALGLAACCVLPGLGVMGALGVGAGFGAWAESVFLGIVLASVGLLAVTFLRNRKKAPSAPQVRPDALPVACDLQVFTREERTKHMELATDVLVRWPKKKTELADGYLFQYEGDESLFLTIARWASLEHGCCAWATFSVEMGPFPHGEKGLIQMRMTAGTEGKAFLTEAFRYMDELNGKAPADIVLHSDQPLTRESLLKKIGRGCGC